jgi:hypothetical protein
LTCAGGLPTPAARYIVHASSLPGRNCFCGRGMCGFLGSKGTIFRHGEEIPAVIRPISKQGWGSIGKGGLEEGQCGKDQLETRKLPPPRKSLSSFFFAKPYRSSTTIQQIASYQIYLSLYLFPPP